MYLLNPSLVLLLWSIQALAILVGLRPDPTLSPSLGLPYSPSSLVSNRTTTVSASSSTPTVKLSIANPTISGIFQMGLNDGLQNLCLGHNSTVPSFAAGSSAATVQSSEKIPAITTTADSPSTATEVYTEINTQTAYAKETTVSAVIDILTFAYASNKVDLNAWNQERAEPTPVTVTETQTATETAIIQEVTRTAVIYLLIPGSSNRPANIFATPSPFLAQHKPLVKSDNQTVPNEPQKEELVDAYKAGFVVGEGMQNPCHEGRLPPGSVVYAPSLKSLVARDDVDLFLQSGDIQHFVRRNLERRRGGGGSGGAHGSGSVSSGSRGSGSGSGSSGRGSGSDSVPGVKPGGGNTSRADARRGLLPGWSLFTLILVVSFVAAGANLRPFTSTNGSTAIIEIAPQAAPLSGLDVFNTKGPEPTPGQIDFFGPRQIDSTLKRKAQADKDASSELERSNQKRHDSGCSSCVNAARKDSEFDPDSLQAAEQAEGFPITPRGATGMEYLPASGTVRSSAPSWTLIFSALLIASSLFAGALATDVQNGQGKHTIQQYSPGVVQWSNDLCSTYLPSVTWAVANIVVILVLSILLGATATASAHTLHIQQLIVTNTSQDGVAGSESAASRVALPGSSGIVSALKVLLFLPIAWTLGYRPSRHPRYRYLCTFGLIASLILVQSASAIILPTHGTPIPQPPSQSTGLSLHIFGAQNHSVVRINRAPIHPHMAVTPQGISTAHHDESIANLHRRQGTLGQQGTLSQQGQMSPWFWPVIGVIAALVVVWLLIVFVVYKSTGKNICSSMLCGCPGS